VSDRLIHLEVRGSKSDIDDPPLIHSTIAASEPQNDIVRSSKHLHKDNNENLEEEKEEHERDGKEEHGVNDLVSPNVVESLASAEELSAVKGDRSVISSDASLVIVRMEQQLQSVMSMIGELVAEVARLKKTLNKSTVDE